MGPNPWTMDCICCWESRGQYFGIVSFCKIDPPYPKLPMANTVVAKCEMLVPAEINENRDHVMRSQISKRVLLGSGRIVDECKGKNTAVVLHYTFNGEDEAGCWEIESMNRT